MTAVLRAAWERASLYLPTLLMGLLALGTYWLVESTPAVKVVPPAGPARQEPDYFMKNFSVRTFVEDGRLSSEVLGIAARHFPDTDTLEIDQVRMRSYDASGRLTTATAKRALTNSDTSEVQLFGQALIVREAVDGAAGQALPRIEFRGEYLHAFIDARRVKSDQPVELRHGKDVFKADTMEFDSQQQLLVLQGRVRGVLAPAPGK